MHSRAHSSQQGVYCRALFRLLPGLILHQFAPRAFRRTPLPPERSLVIHFPAKTRQQRNPKTSQQPHAILETTSASKVSHTSSQSAPETGHAHGIFSKGCTVACNSHVSRCVHASRQNRCQRGQTITIGPNTHPKLHLKPPQFWSTAPLQNSIPCMQPRYIHTLRSIIR